jgi:hypothetical protein
MNTVLAEPVVMETVHQEPEAATPALILVSPKPAPVPADTNPFLVVSIAALISLVISTAVIGSLTMWIYLLRHSGAFAR